MVGVCGDRPDDAPALRQAQRWIAVSTAEKYGTRQRISSQPFPASQADDCVETVVRHSRYAIRIVHF